MQYRSIRGSVPGGLGIGLALLVVASLLAQPALAQVLYGSIVGNVADPSGGAIVGARVVITNIETNQSRETATNATGLYSFPTVPAGTYRLDVAIQGFRS